MDALEIKTVFTLSLCGFTVPVTETVVISWVVMAFLVTVSLLVSSRLRQIPRGLQAILETGVESLEKFAREQFGSLAAFLGPYMGSLFLFLLIANIIGVLSPVEVSFLGREYRPPFVINPPTRDINVTAALAVISILMVLIFGFGKRGVLGWCKQLLHPLPMMLPFNIMEYGTRLISLALRLFGNILGGFVLMHMIEGLIPLAVPMVFSLYFDFFDGLVQAAIFVFLTSLYISEAVKLHEE